MTINRGPRTEARIDEVMKACRQYGGQSIIALSGVPGTGKSFIGHIAAQRLAGEPLRLREIQFHPTYSYEEFIEGYRANGNSGFVIEEGVFLGWNQQALDDPSQQYVLLIEELTRANLPSVLGELLTYIEHRDRPFTTLYSRRPVRLADNLAILATFNPRDRSALEMDDAIIRRLRIIEFPPDTDQLKEMLPGTVPPVVQKKLVDLFDACRDEFGEDYPNLMPFGHGIFSEVTRESPDLADVWHQRIKHLLLPPGRQPHPFFDVIAAKYEWKDERHPAATATQAAPAAPAPADAATPVAPAATAVAGPPQ